MWYVAHICTLVPLYRDTKACIVVNKEGKKILTLLFDFNEIYCAWMEETNYLTLLDSNFFVEEC